MGQTFRDIGSYENNWKSYHNFFGHGLAICYQTSKISLEFPVISPSLRYYQFYAEQVIYIY